MKFPDIFQTHWILDGRILGTAETEGMSYAKGQEHVPYSFVRVCPKCGDDWSRVVVNHPDSKFIPESRLCPNCGGGYIGTYEEHYHMPREAVKHELRMFNPERSYMIFLITGGN